jgi:hypothetical protein
MKNYKPLTQVQIEIATGCVLGDGSIVKLRRKAKNTFLRESHSLTQDEYVSALPDMLGGKTHSGKSRVSVIDGRSVHSKKQTIFESRCHPFFTEMRKKWYLERSGRTALKIVPDDLVLTPLSLAHWYCGDGCLCGRRRIKFCTQGFAVEDVQKLKDKMKAHLGLDTYVGQKNQLFVHASDNEKFMGIVRPHIPWRCMQYKLDLRLQGGKC